MKSAKSNPNCIPDKLPEQNIDNDTDIIKNLFQIAITLGEIGRTIINVLTPVVVLLFSLFKMIGYFINLFLSSIGFIIIIIKDFFMSFWKYIKYALKFIDYLLNLVNRVIDIFYTILGYITGIISYFFYFAETGGEDIFTS